MAPRRKKNDTETKISQETVVTEESKVTESTNEIDPKSLTPAEYFEKMKNLRKDNMPENLKKANKVCEELLRKFEAVGQKKAAEKLKYKMRLLEKEIDLYNAGIKTYVLLEDVARYIKQISEKNVFLIEVENFPRAIPDDVIDKWLAVKDKFDKGYIVFIDYTKETKKEVEKERKEKDPILFGALKVTDNASMRDNTYEKLFFVADWVDEYCDLKFDQMIGQMVLELGINPVHKTDFSDEGIKKELDSF